MELYAVITGHGSDENGCGEFCVTSHHFLINAVFNNTRIFDSAGEEEMTPFEKYLLQVAHKIIEPQDPFF